MYTSFMILVKNGLKKSCTKNFATCKIALLFNEIRLKWYCDIKIAFVSSYCKISIKKICPSTQLDFRAESCISEY